MDFVGNLLLFAALKEFCKSIKHWQSYSHGYGGTLFLTHGVYRTYRTACIINVQSILLSCKPNTFFSVQLVTNVPRYVHHPCIVLPHCMFWASNCRLCLHWYIAALRQRPGKTFCGPGKLEFFGSKRVGILHRQTASIALARICFWVFTPQKSASHWSKWNFAG